jgi:hypothetical protein
MSEFTWHGVYYSDLQSPYALIVLPLAFLAWRAAVPTRSARAVVPEASRFVAAMTLAFAILTILDPISTGPLLRTEALRDSLATTLIPFFFVLLGDLRVLWLALGVARPERGAAGNLGGALGLCAIVPCVAGAGYAITRWIVPDVHGQLLWMIYEAGFLALCVVLSRVWTPRHLGHAPHSASYVQALFGFSAAYYALWLIADLLIVAGRLDLGWAIRIVPNQLYYAFWVPFAYWRFFSLPLGKAAR